MLTNLIIYHIASGQSFFAGAGLILAALAVSRWTHIGWVRRAQNLLVLLGAILVAVSGTPFSLPAYAGLAAATVIWLVLEHSGRPVAKKCLIASRIALAAVWLTAGAVELRWHMMPRVPAIEQPVLAIIGDSVTAGIGENEAVTWPRLLSDRHGIAVRDYSRMGATVGSARKQAARLEPEQNLVILEIGGNDLLGTTTPDQFAAGLERLLDEVCRPGRTVLMFELPLPPFFGAYGRAQRRLARQYGVLLIPKRLLMSVLRQDTATLDSVHLTQAGHERMAQAVWSIVGKACSE